MAHPKRRKQAEMLLVQLAGQGFLFCGITWDQKNDEWHTGKRAVLAGLQHNADYHVILQDDAILPPNFYKHCENALNAVPIRSLVSFYTGTGRPLPDRVTNAVKRAANSSWLVANTLYWGVGIAIPTAHITDMLETIADRTEVYDTRIGIAYQCQRLPVYYTNPSLVDHDDEMGSLLKQSKLIPLEQYEKDARHAHNFIGNRQVSWNTSAIDI